RIGREEDREAVRAEREDGEVVRVRRDLVLEHPARAAVRDEPLGDTRGEGVEVGRAAEEEVAETDRLAGGEVVAEGVGDEVAVRAAGVRVDIDAAAEDASAQERLGRPALRLADEHPVHLGVAAEVGGGGAEAVGEGGEGVADGGVDAADGGTVVAFDPWKADGDAVVDLGLGPEQAVRGEGRFGAWGRGGGRGGFRLGGRTRGGEEDEQDEEKGAHRSEGEGSRQKVRMRSQRRPPGSPRGRPRVALAAPEFTESCAGRGRRAANRSAGRVYHLRSPRPTPRMTDYLAQQIRRALGSLADLPADFDPAAFEPEFQTP